MTANFRSDIADRLHKVIETQWQKTLEIITSDPSSDSNLPSSNNLNHKTNDLQDSSECATKRRNSLSKCNVNLHTPQLNKLKKHLNKSLD